jgi:hypothetical protein
MSADGGIPLSFDEDGSASYHEAEPRIKRFTFKPESE